MTGEAAIRALLERLRAALHDRNADAFVRLLTPDGTGYSMAPPLAESSEAAKIRSKMQLWFDTWDGPIRQDTPHWEIVAGDDCAFAYGLTRMSGRKRGGEVDELWFRQTLGLKRIDGDWRIHHSHESVPFAMDGSDRALLDLTPDSAVDPRSAVGG